jgi:hypothetical protein
LARAADTAATNANTQYAGASTSALNNANADAAKGNADISSLEASNPYTSKSYIQNQNLQTSAAMNSQDMAAKQQLDGAALRTGTNTAALGRTIASNDAAGQRSMDAYNAGTATQNVDKTTALQQGLIQDRNAQAGTQAGLYGTSANGQNNAETQLTNLQGQNTAMWGNIIGGAAGAAGSVFQAKG